MMKNIVSYLSRGEQNDAFNFKQTKEDEPGILEHGWPLAGLDAADCLDWPAYLCLPESLKSKFARKNA
jgi:hypothetical protein